MASRVSIRTRTVESHRNNIMHKLQVTAFSDLVRYALRHKVVPAESRHGDGVSSRGYRRSQILRQKKTPRNREIPGRSLFRFVRLA